MRFKTAVFLTVLFSVAAFQTVCLAEVDWSVLRTFNLEEPPQDVAFSGNRNQIYVLSTQGHILIYNTSGSLLHKIEVGPDIDRMQLVQGSDVLFLTSRKNKTIQIVQLDFVQKINIAGSPYMGPDNAPVVIAVFSEFQ
jgi:hypothetical protein